jgi:hypothetical protein
LPLNRHLAAATRGSELNPEQGFQSSTTTTPDRTLLRISLSTCPANQQLAAGCAVCGVFRIRDPGQPVASCQLPASCLPVASSWLSVAGSSWQQLPVPALLSLPFAICHLPFVFVFVFVFVFFWLCALCFDKTSVLCALLAFAFAAFLVPSC